MKTFIILLFILLCTRIGVGQDSIKVASDDWNYIKTTYLEVDSALTESQELNKLYEKRTKEYALQVKSLKLANQAADTIISKKNQQLEKRKEQVSILNNELRKKKIENYILKGSTGVLIIAVILILL